MSHVSDKRTAGTCGGSLGAMVKRARHKRGAGGQGLILVGVPCPEIMGCRTFQH